jgi:hypothetical protein
MQLLDDELARRTSEGVILRAQPLRVKWSVEGLVANDGHKVNVRFSCSVRALPEPSEREMLAEVLLNGKHAAFDKDVAEHFRSPLRNALFRAAEGKSGSELISDEGRELLANVLKSAAKPIAFACGVEVMPPFDVEVDSPTLQEQRLRSMQRVLTEQHAAGQLEHIQRAGELLQKFQAIRQATPDVSAGQVLQQVSPADRGALLQTLLLASAKESPLDLWAVAGPYLVRIDLPEGGSPKHELFPLPPTLGPLRSVQRADVDGKRVLLVGARSGFFVVDPNNPTADAQAYADTDVESQLGFSRVIYWPTHKSFVACHGDAGIVRWELGKMDAPVETARTKERFAHASIDGQGPRNLEVAPGGGSVVFSVGSRLFLTTVEQTTGPLKAGSDSDIVAILSTGGSYLLIVHEDGTTCRFDPRSLGDVSCVEQGPNALKCAAPLPWLGGMRLLLAAEEGPVACAGLDDDLVTQYVSPHKGLRALTGSPRHVAGLSADRQRVLLWNTWDGRKPVAEVYLGGAVRHRVADVEFG